ncbi:DUF2975 domain-containing protein [Halobacillus kuroshimensis]|uniref:DUF2975 domain-containing protein n=1 Tax=Halobacillus kuroshimensis TaxID=302481 RepID=UPI0004841380|nr:DUF2975 domain-containing protein [Halobacillus kuroshimensis]
MKKGSTIFLTAVIYVLGLGVLILCVFLLPWTEAGARGMWGSHYPVLIGMYAAAVPFFTALYEALRLLRLIEKEAAFSEASVHSLAKIKRSAFAVSAIYVLVFPFFYRAGEVDDAPGLIAAGLAFMAASFVIGVFAAVLQALLKQALEIKKENDLTV